MDGSWDWVMSHTNLSLRRSHVPYEYFLQRTWQQDISHMNQSFNARISIYRHTRTYIWMDWWQRLWRLPRVYGCVIHSWVIHESFMNESLMNDELLWVIHKWVTCEWVIRFHMIESLIYIPLNESVIPTTTKKLASSRTRERFMYVCMYVHVCLCIHIFAHTCLHTQKHRHRYTDVQTHSLRFKLSLSLAHTHTHTPTLILHNPSHKLQVYESRM